MPLLSLFVDLAARIRSAEFLLHAAHPDRPSAFTRQRKLPLPALVALLLSGMRKSIQSELDEFFAHLNNQAQLVRIVSEQAFAQARAKLSLTTIPLLNDWVIERAEYYGFVPRWNGLRLVAADASTVRFGLRAPLCQGPDCIWSASMACRHPTPSCARWWCHRSPRRPPKLCHCGDPGAAGDREDPHAPEIAGAYTAPGTGPSPGAARGLRPPNRDSSGDPATTAAGVGCIRVVAGPMEAARRPRITRRRRQRETHFGWAINAQQLASRSQPVSKDRFKHVGRCVPPLFCRIRAAVGKERGRLKSLPPPSRGHAALIPDASGRRCVPGLRTPPADGAGGALACCSLHRITAFSSSRSAPTLCACALTAVFEP